MRKADSKTDISDATVSLTNEKKLVSVVDKDHPVTLSKEDIEVTLGDKVLRYGIDYKLTYNNNEAPGTATAIVTGIGQYGYTGSQEVSFTIELKKTEMNNISIKSFPTKPTYTEGETLDPTGLVLTTSYDNGTTADVVYSEETAKDFAFNPDTNTPLTKDNTKVTVTYGDFETEFAITVTEAKKPDPEPKPDPEKPNPEKPDPESRVQKSRVQKSQVQATRIQVSRIQATMVQVSRTEMVAPQEIQAIQTIQIMQYKQGILHQ